MDRCRFGSIWRMDCYERLGGKLLWSIKKHNLIPDEGLDNILSLFVPPYTPVANWYVGLIDDAGFSSLQYSDTAAQIGGTNGWAEWVAYSEATRQSFVGVDAASSGGAGQVDNLASQAIFTMNAAGTLNGAFLVSDNGKGSTSGLITSEVNFDTGTEAVIIGNVIAVTMIMQGNA